MDINAIVEMLLVGLILLALLNLVLEVLGLSVLGGDRKPGLVMRLVLVLVLSAAVGFGVTNYLPEGNNVDLKIKVGDHDDGGGEG